MKLEFSEVIKKKYIIHSCIFFSFLSKSISSKIMLYIKCKNYFTYMHLFSRIKNKFDFKQLIFPYSITFLLIILPITSYIYAHNTHINVRDVGTNVRYSHSDGKLMFRSNIVTMVTRFHFDFSCVNQLVPNKLYTFLYFIVNINTLQQN